MASGIRVLLLIIASFLTAGFVGWVVTLFNSLIQVKNNIGKAWHNIDVLLLQRNEELPKLMDLVKAYGRHEQDLLRSLTVLRTSYGNARSTTAKTNIENQIREKIGYFAAAGEQYPDLKSIELYQKTMKRISDLEGSIADRRAFFNDTVNIYNIQIEQFPQVILASLLRYRPHPYLNHPLKKTGAA